MTKERPKRVESNDRSMDTEKEDRSQVFFFPKTARGPVSVKAATRAEAEKQLKALTTTEHD